MNRLEWRAEVAKQLILHDVTLKELAAETGRRYTTVCAAVRGERGYGKLAKEISDRLGIEMYEGRL